MEKIHTVRNNKVEAVNHIYRLKSPVNGDVRAIMVRIEAVSFRSYWSGTNSWELFFLCPVNGAEDSKFSAFPLGKSRNREISRYSGQSTGVMEFQEEETPFGMEWVPAGLLEPEGVALRHATANEVAVAAEAALIAVGEGFGPHGEINNAHALEAWAKEVLSLRDDT